MVVDSLLSSSLLAGYKVEISTHPIKVQLNQTDLHVTGLFNDPCQLMFEKCDDVAVTTVYAQADYFLYRHVLNVFIHMFRMWAVRYTIHHRPLFLYNDVGGYYTFIFCVTTQC